MRPPGFPNRQNRRKRKISIRNAKNRREQIGASNALRRMTLLEIARTERLHTFR
jgi:hypothetical protein